MRANHTFLLHKSRTIHHVHSADKKNSVRDIVFKSNASISSSNAVSVLATSTWKPQKPKHKINARKIQIEFAHYPHRPQCQRISCEWTKKKTVNNSGRLQTVAYMLLPRTTACCWFFTMTTSTARRAYTNFCCFHRVCLCLRNHYRRRQRLARAMDNVEWEWYRIGAPYQTN